MATSVTRSRFVGSEGQRDLLEALSRNPVLRNQPDVLRLITANDELIELDPGTVLIEQGGVDRDVFFLLAGETDILVDGMLVDTRGTDECVGEMAALDPPARRSATVKARTPVLAVRVSGPNYRRMLDKHPGFEAAIREIATGIPR